jgi:integrase
MIGPVHRPTVPICGSGGSGDHSAIRRLTLRPKVTTARGVRPSTIAAIRSFMAALSSVSSEVPLILVHDLRHTAATLMLLAGVNPKVVSERLGHATIGITLQTYSHVLPTMQQDAAAVLDALLRADAPAVGRGGGR